MAQNVFTEMEGVFAGNTDIDQLVSYYNPEEFEKLVQARRSVRKFTSDKIPEEIVAKCLELALLAPNSSNLQTWKFYRIKNQKIKDKIIEACFSQNAAKSASDLIICVTEPRIWKKHGAQMLDVFKTLPFETPKPALEYYSKLIHFVYTVGYFNILFPFKWLFNTIVGWFKVVPREPLTNADLNLWAAKSAALACENLMLALRSYGYDTCPMEGYDSKRLKRAIGLSCYENVIMVIGAGKRAEGGIYGPRIRFPKEQFIKEI